MKKPPPLSNRAALQIARSLLDSGRIRISSHVRQRMKERHFDIQDVLHIIETGSILKRPEWNEDFEEYNYFIGGQDLTGHQLTIKVAISAKADLLALITGY